MKADEFRVQTIGKVDSKNGTFRLRIDPAFREGMKALEGFTHVNVLWWADQVDKEDLRKILDTGKPYKKSPNHVGVFATRSPARPNPIGLTAVPVLGIDHARGTIDVAFIDAEHGTPILDLKPYHPAVDRIKEVATPAWCSHWPEWYEDSASFDWPSEFTF
jgi:tRNA-Thr(GGU) m(6)t(6)A37 methyltransferase TsaA